MHWTKPRLRTQTYSDQVSQKVKTKVRAFRKKKKKKLITLFKSSVKVSAYLKPHM